MKLWSRITFFSIFLWAAFAAPAEAQFDDCTDSKTSEVMENSIFDGKPPELDDFGYLVRGAAWIFCGNEERKIYVCWESPTKENEKARGWIQDQITKTWEKHTALKFGDWIKCGLDNLGIRILLADDPPKVKRFGRQINKVQNGMVLNSTFKFWKPSPDCSTKPEPCVRQIAVHEFGHALGFAHEMNRPKTPGECKRKKAQPGQENEKILTPYDLKSVMNYCNPKKYNGGELSALDIKSAQKLYGKP